MSGVQIWKVGTELEGTGLSRWWWTYNYVEEAKKREKNRKTADEVGCFSIFFSFFRLFCMIERLIINATILCHLIRFPLFTLGRESWGALATSYFLSPTTLYNSDPLPIYIQLLRAKSFALKLSYIQCFFYWRHKNVRFFRKNWLKALFISQERASCLVGKFKYT